MIASFIILLFVGFIAGLSNGLVGIGGGIFVVPILTILGVDHSIAVASAANIMISGAYSSFRTYNSKSLVDFKLACFLIPGGFLGVLIGSVLVNFWLQNSTLDQSISILLLLVLMMMSLLSIFSLVKKKSYVAKDVKEIKIILHDKLVNKNILKQKFISFEKKMPILTIVFLGVLAGFLTPVLGIGGSIVMLPVLLNILKITPSYVTGTINLHVLISAILATTFHYGMINNSNFSISLILILGTVVGSQIGSRLGASTAPKMKLKIANLVLLIITVFYILFGLTEGFYEFNLIQIDSFISKEILNKYILAYTAFCIAITIFIGHISYHIGAWIAKKAGKKRV